MCWNDFTDLDDLFSQLFQQNDIFMFKIQISVDLDYNNCELYFSEPHMRAVIHESQ